MTATNNLGSTNTSVDQGDLSTNMKVKSSEGSVIETDQGDQWDAFIDQSTKVLHKNQEAKETNTSMISRRYNRSPSPLDNRDTWTAIMWAKMKDSDLTVGEYTPNIMVKSESIVASQR